ncbi:MAG: hypothetical protein SXQ77_10105 [Halobacteria archaeon]|nr:hypothetical protein [Halobacteria archaeon]
MGVAHHDYLVDIVVGINLGKMPIFDPESVGTELEEALYFLVRRQVGTRRDFVEAEAVLFTLLEFLFALLQIR